MSDGRRWRGGSGVCVQIWEEDGAWRRWVVRDDEEMMMGCCVREMELWSLESASRSGRKMELGGDGL
ncbi:hypothetical protein MRB53_020733 [Persea americana]|uniref:Uncharacterized protein n=1 Tax=Persea americana TaxID=3435 RepID=A0ACC2L2N3_PERAE|nr:hypothetical protein MRB53_020733 [Persea americana]